MGKWILIDKYLQNRLHSMLMNGVTFPIKEKRKRAKQTEKRKEKKGKRPGAPDEP